MSYLAAFSNCFLSVVLGNLFMICRGIILLIFLVFGINLVSLLWFILSNLENLGPFFLTSLHPHTADSDCTYIRPLEVLSYLTDVLFNLGVGLFSFCFFLDNINC